MCYVLCHVKFCCFEGSTLRMCLFFFFAQDVRLHSSLYEAIACGGQTKPTVLLSFQGHIPWFPTVRNPGSAQVANVTKRLASQWRTLAARVLLNSRLCQVILMVVE